MKYSYDMAGTHVMDVQAMNRRKICIKTVGILNIHILQFFGGNLTMLVSYNRPSHCDSALWERATHRLTDSARYITSLVIMHPHRGPNGRGVADRQHCGALVFPPNMVTICTVCVYIAEKNHMSKKNTYLRLALYTTH